MSKWLYTVHIILRDHLHAEMAQHTVHILRDHLHAEMAQHTAHMLRNRLHAQTTHHAVHMHAKRLPPCPNGYTQYTLY